jgi:2-phosphosulfolactate phosphatase
MYMPAEVRVHFLPALADADHFQGRTVVVVDILRATTTIVHALAAGAKEVIPLLDVAEAREKAQLLPNAVLGGERGGKRIEGFQLGNSPVEYTAAAVRGRSVVFTTTNGTRAMQLCRQANRVFMGSFNALAALSQAVQSANELDILCAGTDGEITREDVLFAGALVASLPSHYQRNDSAALAADAWQTVLHNRAPSNLATYLAASQGGRNLIEIGQAHDIPIAAEIDRFNLVAELDLASWSIRQANPPK